MKMITTIRNRRLQKASNAYNEGILLRNDIAKYLIPHAYINGDTITQWASTIRRHRRRRHRRLVDLFFDSVHGHGDCSIIYIDRKLIDTLSSK